MQCLAARVCLSRLGKVRVRRGVNGWGEVSKGESGRRRGQRTKGAKGWVTHDPLGHCKEPGLPVWGGKIIKQIMISA